MNEVNNISRSFADNVNYLAELDKQYYTDGFIKRNGIQLGTQEYFGKVTMNVFDKSQKKHIVSDIISGSIVGNSGLEQFLLDMKTSIETLYNDVIVNVVVSNGTGAIADKNINITLSSTDTIMGLIQIDVSMYTNPGVVADYTKYSILSASNEYIAILPYLSTLDNDFNNSILSIAELSDEIVNVSNNSEKINSIVQYIIPHIDEILLSDDMAEQAEASAMLAEASKIAASLSAVSSLASKNSASSSEASSLTYKNSASISATTAATSATNASISATQSATSAGESSASASSASSAAINANDSSIGAASSASEALISKNSAISSASSAGVSATNALASEIKAEKWASELEDVEVETGEYSAKHWALKSKKLSAGTASNISYDNIDSGLSSSNTQDAIDELDNNLDNLSANVYTKSEINASLSTKVDKVIGKQLSTEDFTTAEKNKLIGIAIGANNYTLPTATSTVKGGIELYSDTVQTVASNAITNTASRTYGLQFNSAGQAVVNVPWVDTNTVYTHPVSGATAGTYKSITVDINGHVTSGTNPTTVSGYGLTDVYTKTESNSSLALKVNNSEKGIANGIATLDLNGKVVLSQIPDGVLGQLEYMGTWDFTTVLPTATQKGQYWISSISGNGYAVGDWSVWNGTAFDKVDNTDAVSSVAGRTGNVVLAKSDVGLANVDNTTDSSKPVSMAQQAALNLKANIASPVFTGNVTGLGVATGTSFNSITGLSSVVGTTNGTAAVGTSTTVARADHVHPVQTTIAGNAATATALQTSRNIGGVAFNGTSDITLPGVNATGNQATTGNAGTATKLATTRNIALTGDVTGNVDFDGTANVSIAATIAENSVALGTDTTGNYVAGNTAGTGIAVTGTAGEGWSPTIALTNVGTAGTYKSVTTDAQGRITSGTNPTTLSGYGITDAATALRTTATFTTVANTWYRIATSAVGIDRNSAEFVVDWTVSGAHGSTRFAAGCHHGETAGVSLMQTNYSKYGTSGITEARIVYHTTITGNYAYVEVKFAGALTNVIVNVEMQDTIGWSLVSPSTAGSVPAGYTSYLHTFVPSAAIAAGTYPKVTINQEGRVTSGSALVAIDIPSLDASKITTGTLPVTRGGTGVTTSTGTGNVVLSTSPTLVTPNIGVATATSISSTGTISGGGITSTGNTGFKNDTYVLNSRNPIWSFGNALTYGISYYQASAGIGNKDTIAFDFGTNTSAAAKFYVTSAGDLSASGSISSNGVVIGTLAEFTAALG